jgi:hypothetical protein
MDPEDSHLLRLITSDRPPPAEQQVGVLWALAMMNGEGTLGAVDPARGPVLGAITSFPMSDDERIDALHLVTLSRYPTSEERERLRAYLESGRSRGDRDEALADIMWALINSSEFLVNH